MAILYLVTAYLLFAFPFAYFRHDDWIILGNSVWHVAPSLSSAFHPTLYFGGNEEIWFFRPFFKLIVLGFYKLFGFNYYYWLVSTLLMLVGAMVAGAKSLQILSPSGKRSTLFLILFAASVHLHFGSLIWAGEGMMNCPQLFLLFFNLWFFLHATTQRAPMARAINFTAAFILFLLSLGFKESGIFHSVLLGSLVVCESYFRKFSWRKKIAWLMPYAIITPVYLFVRLRWIPINPGYIPHLSVTAIAPALIVISGSLLLPALGLILFSKKIWKTLQRSFVWSPKWMYLGLVALVSAPYLGHPFFSPGWLMFPGMYATFLLALVFPLQTTSPFAYRRLGLTLLFLSLFPIVTALWKLGWWKWEEPQRQIVSIFKSYSPTQVENITIYECTNPRYPKSSLSRVVASPEGFFEMWRVVHGSTAKVEVASCDAGTAPRTPARNELRIRWEFPQFTVLR